jgi:hypothetical protein
VRLNKASDGLGDVEILDGDAWRFHPDSAIDVAVLPYNPPEWAKAKASSTKHVISEFKQQTKDIGPGDLSYIVGMFDQMRGDLRNAPTVHVGYIGSSPGEKVQVDDWRAEAADDAKVEIEGWLIQVPTLAGSSGSPVFVRRTVGPFALGEVDAEAKKIVGVVKAWTYGTVWLLGLWHGAWESTGMGLCIPAPRIIEALEHAERPRNVESPPNFAAIVVDDAASQGSFSEGLSPDVARNRGEGTA